MNEFLQQLVNGLAWGSIYALIALGYTMVYGVLRLVNFAHGDIYMVGAMTGYYTATYFAKAPSWLILPATLLSAMIVCALLASLIERFAYRPLRQAPPLNALMTAVGVSLFLQYFGQYLFGANPKFFPTLIENKVFFQSSGLVIHNIQVLIFVVSIVLMALLTWIIQKTRFGKAMRAVSYSHTASSLMGIDVSKIINRTFILGSILAAVAGILVGISNPKVEPLMGLMPGIKSFIAAVLGGIGNIPGAFLGGILLGVSETLVAGYLSSTYRDALAFILLIVILLIRPQGLLGKKVSEKV